ncbi:LON peptidase substrate-binding domain-containing protein [Tahibacter caeni]|uniref:LON peptidase substrate-binding domain-containing protein n=1 Tax=Tahibacter caeni TaxID=1453545 RepID=UPI0021495C11|nr:LON peptidase substrate-binding domain-containing protein [Tahibacter caeni]
MAYTAPVTTQDDIPLFPLGVVLFPGGLLSLRIFEPRYLDLVRECSRNGGGFGVCLILAGREVGEPATPAAVGTLAHIEDFYALPDGLLGIRARGSRRFRVTTTRVRDNGLVHGNVDWWPDEPAIVLPPEYALLAVILERLLEQVGGEHAQAQRHCLDDASWVGFRLAELLPVSPAERQHWLQLTDPLQRLDGLMRCVPRFQAD